MPPPAAGNTAGMAELQLAGVLWSGVTYALIGVAVAAAVHGIVVLLRGAAGELNKLDISPHNLIALICDTAVHRPIFVSWPLFDGVLAPL
jgi:hypothetical protein